MKKVLVCALAVFFLMASCSTAFAATITTTTAYVSDTDTSKMTVTTTVSGATEGSMYTFLATNDDKENKAIVDADQKTVDSTGTVTFSYTGNTTDVANHIAYSGNNEGVELHEGNNLTRAIMIRFKKSGSEDEDEFIKLEGMNYLGGTQHRIFLPKYNPEVASIPFVIDIIPYYYEIDYILTADKDKVIYENGRVADHENLAGFVTVYLKDAVDNAGEVIKATSFWRANGNEILTVLVKIKSAAPATVEGKNIGVYIEKDGQPWNLGNHTDGKYPSMAGIGSDGTFAIQFINEDAMGEFERSEWGEGEWTVQAYAGDNMTGAKPIEYQYDREQQ